MLTDEGPKVLEYNARFGDPETQVLLPRLDGDWVPWLTACASGDLGSERPRWTSDAAVCVVMTAGGYPGEYIRNAVIRGVEDAEALEGVLVFHAGTHRNQNGDLATSSGRVLGVTALGRDLSAARERAYEAVARIRWDGERHRHDIAKDALESTEGRSGS
jgi:phosphoribosylamine--glycine ligase